MGSIYPILLANSYEENCLVTRKDNTDDTAILAVNKNMFSECFHNPNNYKLYLITVHFYLHVQYALDFTEF